MVKGDRVPARIVPLLYLGTAHLSLALACVLVAWSPRAIAGFFYHSWMPGFVLSNVFAHAHLAALGWGAMIVIGVAYRLLPMTLPSKMPGGRSLFGSAALLEAGVLGLFVTLLLRSAWMQQPKKPGRRGCGRHSAQVV